MTTMDKNDRRKAYSAIRQHASSFAGTFLQLAVEARQTRGIKNARLEFGQYPATRRVTSKVNAALSSLVVTLPDPITTLKLGRLDIHDPGFYATVAMAIHETAHLIFGSLDVEHECADSYATLAWNVVLDSCDESALVTHIAPGAAMPLGVCNTLVFKNNIEPDIVEGKKAVSRLAAQLLILSHTPCVEDLTRLQHTSMVNRSADQALQKLVGFACAQALSNLLLGAVHTAVNDANIEDEDMRVVPIMARRISSTWDVLSEAADKIAAILRNLDPTQDDSAEADGADTCSLPDSKPQESKSQSEATEACDTCNDAMKQAKDALVTKLRGETAKTDSLVNDGGNERVQNNLVVRQPHRFNQYRAAMRRLMRQLLRSKKLVPCVPAMRGSIVRDVARAYTDGHIFLKREEVESTNAAIAFILDCSYSTQPFLEKMLMFCGCLAQGAQEAGASVACWLFGTEYMPIATKMLYRIAPPDFGGTVLSPVYGESLKWLAAHDAFYQKRICVVMTDGQPYYKDRPKIRELHDKYSGVHSLVGCIEGVDLDSFVTDSMPRATSFVVRKDFAVSAMLLAKRIERVKPYGI